ncbi:MAG TPA: hypothetical protein VGB95_03555, partial [Chitinophagales bacterium]
MKKSKTLLTLTFIALTSILGCISNPETIWLCNNTLLEFDAVKLNLENKGIKYGSLIGGGSDLKLEIEKKYEKLALECGFVVCDSVNKELTKLRENLIKYGVQIFCTRLEFDSTAKGIQTYIYNGGDSSSGAFKDGEMEGKWKFWFSNGNISQEGSFKYGLEDGEWKYYSKE